jgi:predicted TIM-barrel fold metal-dependent hydrolase
VIIDCHTHLNRYSPTDAPTLAERYARLVAEMDANGVAHSVVLTSYDITPDRPSPDDVLAIVEHDPRFSVVAGISYPHLGGDQIGYLRGLLQARRIRGLKLYPGYQPFHLSDRRLHPVYEMAAEFGVPVMIHTGDTFSPTTKVRYAHPLEVDDVAVDFRETTIVMCHLGNPWFQDAMEVIYKNENVLGDFCGLTLGAFEERYERLALRRVNDVIAYVNDPGKLMFGTDWPISDIASYLRFTDKLELTEAEREGVLWRNAARVFGIAVDGMKGGADVQRD